MSMGIQSDKPPFDPKKKNSAVKFGKLRVIGNRSPSKIIKGVNRTKN